MILRAGFGAVVGVGGLRGLGLFRNFRDWAFLCTIARFSDFWRDFENVQVETKFEANWLGGRFGSGLDWGAFVALI
jgi:hypothetical protein